MELKEGMYIRTIYGNIAKIIDNRDNVIVKTDDNTTHLRSMIINASDNLIDLIEVGDYVNGYKVIYVHPNLIKVDSADIWEIHSSDIKSIITKEQFASVKYEVE